MNILRVPTEAIDILLNDGEREVPVVMRFGRVSIDLILEQPDHFLELSLHVVRGRVQLVTRNYGPDESTHRPVVTDLLTLPPLDDPASPPDA